MQLLNRMGPRLMTTIGLACVSTAVFMMSRWTLDVGRLQTIIPLMINGFGLAMLFIPLMNAGLAAVDRRKVTGAAGLLNLQLQLGASFGTAILATMVENGIQRYHAMLVEHASPTNPVFQTTVHQLAARLIQRGGADSVTAQQQAMAAVDGIISTQAAMLSFEHAFQVVAAVILIMLVCVPFLRRPAPGAGAPATH